MTEAQEATDRAAEPVACPECGEADLVQKISAISDWPAEYGPPAEPRSIDLRGVALVVLGAVCIALLTLLPYQLYRYLYGSAFARGVFRHTSFYFGLIVGVALEVLGARSLYTWRWKRAHWKEAMRRWERLYLCPRDDVAFIPGGTSVIPVQEMQGFLYAQREDLPDLTPKQRRFADFSPMPEEFADFERMLKETKEKSGTLICYECGHCNPVGQSQCEDCGVWVPQSAKGRWAY